LDRQFYRVVWRARGKPDLSCRGKAEGTMMSRSYLVVKLVAA
jgi:hypothetical protein